MANTFVWGGQTWTYGQLGEFSSYLAAHGTSYDTWAGNHPTAASILEVSPQTYHEEQGYNESTAGPPTWVTDTPPPPAPPLSPPPPPPPQAPVPSNSDQTARNQQDPRVYQPPTRAAVQPTAANTAQLRKNEAEPPAYQAPPPPHVLRVPLAANGKVTLSVDEKKPVYGHLPPNPLTKPTGPNDVPLIPGQQEVIPVTAAQIEAMATLPRTLLTEAKSFLKVYADRIIDPHALLEAARSHALSHEVSRLEDELKKAIGQKRYQRLETTVSFIQATTSGHLAQAIESALIAEIPRGASVIAQAALSNITDRLTVQDALNSVKVIETLLTVATIASVIVEAHSFETGPHKGALNDPRGKEFLLNIRRTSTSDPKLGPIGTGGAVSTQPTGRTSLLPGLVPALLPALAASGTQTAVAMPFLSSIAKPYGVDIHTYIYWTPKHAAG